MRAWSLLIQTHDGVVSILKELTLEECRKAYERFDSCYGMTVRRRKDGGASWMHHHPSPKIREVFGPADWDRTEMDAWNCWPKFLPYDPSIPEDED